MEICVRGRLMWELFVAIHPVLKKALPKRGSVDRARLATQNDISKIRHGIRAIPLILPDVDIDQEKLDDAIFAAPLQSLLEVLDTLVSNNIRTATVGEARESLRSADPQEPLECDELQAKFTNLMAVMNAMKSINPATGMVTSSVNRRKQAIAQLASYIKFEEPSLPVIVKTLRNFRSAVDKLFRDPVDELKRNIGNADRLADEETSFIRRADYLKGLSQELFIRLAGSITCSGVHKAQLHLSGFLASDATFELCIPDCTGRHWRLAKCRRRTPTQTALRPRPEQSVCVRRQVQTESKHTCIKLDQEDMWHDEVQDREAYDVSQSDQDPTMHELILGTRHNANLEAYRLSAQEKRVVQILVASSLLNLDTSHWMQSGLDRDKVSLRVAKTAADILSRWRPYIVCSLQTQDHDNDENDAVLSFGLLLMEMEANKTAEPKPEDESWDGSGLSRGSMLKRILVEWDGDVDDQYKDIATACLFFRQLSDRFYDSSLTQDTKRTGAMYKYIFAPLFKLFTNKFRKLATLFTGIPCPSGDRSAQSGHALRRPVTNSELLLFDGSEVALPTQQGITDARKFMEDLERFAVKIERVTGTSPVPFWDKWRASKITIAIIDTGIDTVDDGLVKTAREEGRIQECCGFLNDQDSDPDPTDYLDVNGHGTHVARLVLSAAPSAEIFIAKISNKTTINCQHLHRISRAIRWATEKKVNIISMSFGLDQRDVDIDKAIYAAKNANISIFCAAANSGGNKPRAYPASKKTSVLCIHASDGMGNDGGLSPTPLRGSKNFTTLGIAIPSKWKKKEVFISGTSFATPIAAAFVANVLEFARRKCNLDEHNQALLFGPSGVDQILGLMVQEGAEPRGGYDYVMPFHLWTLNQTDSNVAEKIRDVAITL